MLHASLTTVVRDAGRLGGGMADVALNVHSRLAEFSQGGNLICAIAPERQYRNVSVVGSVGQSIWKVRDEQFGDVTHIHGIWTLFEWLTYRAAKRGRTKLVVSPHGALEPWALNHKRLKKRVAWWTYQRSVLNNADLLIVNSPQELVHLRALGLRAPIAVIPNGVDEPQNRQAEGIPREKVILFLSRLTEKKGVPVLLDAWHKLADKNGYTLHVRGFGEPAYVDFLQRRIDELGDGTTVKLLPAVFGAEKWTAYQRASTYVLPSFSENFGITVAEAMLGGLPVITTKATPWAMIEAEGLGWIVDTNVMQLQACLERVVGTPPEELSEMGRRARRFATERFAWDKVIEKYATTYAWLMRPTTQPPSWLDIMS